MPDNKMNIIELSKKYMNEIEGLWKELNSLHRELSSNFKSHFESFTFDNRVKQLSIKENLSIFVAKEADANIGYCVVTKDNEIGEIDSLFVRKEYQGQGVGHELMSKAFEWLKNKKCSAINIYVAEGNESVLTFYEKYGFKKRFTVLQKAEQSR